MSSIGRNSLLIMGLFQNNENGNRTVTTENDSQVLPNCYDVCIC